MKRLTPPNFDFAAALQSAISGIGDEVVRTVHSNAFLDSAAIEASYAASAQAATLFALPRVPGGGGDPIAHNGLLRSELVNLYTQYFVPEKKPARHLYEAIKVTANGKCPLCGGVGHVRTLDHYLPKANFPVFAVLPTNLVPCCRDCNSEKLNSFALVRGDQTIHPYFDADLFFEEQWIEARVVPSNPPVIEFFVRPPEHWHPDDKARVRSHFVQYGLGEKFSVEAAVDIPETIQTRRTTLHDLSPIAFSEYLREKSQNGTLPVNNWRRVMFAALAADEWFCAEAFGNV